VCARVGPMTVSDAVADLCDATPQRPPCTEPPSTTGFAGAGWARRAGRPHGNGSSSSRPRPATKADASPRQRGHTTSDRLTVEVDSNAGVEQAFGWPDPRPLNRATAGPGLCPDGRRRAPDLPSAEQWATSVAMCPLTFPGPQIPDPSDRTDRRQPSMVDGHRPTPQQNALGLDRAGPFQSRCRRAL